MALPEMEVVCTQCHTRQRAQPKRTLLAFLRFKCSNCRKDFTYPLTSGYRITYWVILAITGLAIIGTLAMGRVGFPGLLALLSAYALAKDARLRKEVSAAEELSAARGGAA